MMPASSNITSSTVSSELVFAGGGRRRVLTVVRRADARRLRLVIDPRNATVRLTLPRRAAVAPALAWAAGKRAWVEAELARLPAARPIVPGLQFDLGDERMRIEWAEGFSRSPQLSPGVLRVGGPLDGLAPRVLRFLRAHAAAVLAAETRALAAAHAIDIGSVSVGDQRGRWGSCSVSGDIRYSWRLILAPAFVRTATVAHELAHRLHMDHSPAFHHAHRHLLGDDPAPARDWLRANGTALHWFGVAD